VPKSHTKSDVLEVSLKSSIESACAP